MPKPYDVVTKLLIDSHPSDWLALIGLPNTAAEPLEIELLDTDLSTVTSQSDRVLKLREPAPHLQHIELESGHHGSETADRLLLYSTLIRKKYKLSVRSTVILLRSEADSPALTGVLQYYMGDEPYLSFTYNVIRVWEIPVEELLIGGLGTLPIAPLAKVDVEQLPDIIRRMKERVDSETTLDEEREIWTSTNILTWRSQNQKGIGLSSL